MNTNSIKLSSEEESFLRDLYTKNYSRIYNYIKLYISDTNIARDITSDVFALACEKIGILKPHPNPIGWLYNVAKNKINEFLHRLNNAPELLLPESLDNEEASDTSAYKLAELKITFHNSLSPEEYDRFLRYFVWGHSLQQMADYDGVTKSAMATRLTRLRAKIRALL